MFRLIALFSVKLNYYKHIHQGKVGLYELKATEKLH